MKRRSKRSGRGGSSLRVEAGNTARSGAGNSSRSVDGNISCAEDGNSSRAGDGNRLRTADSNSSCVGGEVSDTGAPPVAVAEVGDTGVAAMAVGEVGDTGAAPVAVAEASDTGAPPMAVAEVSDAGVALVGLAEVGDTGAPPIAVAEVGDTGVALVGVAEVGDTGAPPVAVAEVSDASDSEDGEACAELDPVSAGGQRAVDAANTAEHVLCGGSLMEAMTAASRFFNAIFSTSDGSDASSGAAAASDGSDASSGAPAVAAVNSVSVATVASIGSSGVLGVAGGGNTANQPATTVVEIDSLVAKAGRQSVGPVSLKLGAGEVMIVLGVEDSGKSALLGALAGVGAPVSGHASICGHLVGNRESKRLLGYVPRGLALYDELTCAGYLHLFAAAYGVDRHYVPYMVHEALEYVHLEQNADTLISAIDNDYARRRLGLARALIHDPRVMLVDDVLSGVEPTNMRSYLDILEELRSTGKVMILSSQTLCGLEGLCSRICLLVDGKVVLCGILSEVRPQFASYHLMYMQLLDGPSVDICLKELGQDKRVLGLVQGAHDMGLLRFLFVGSLNELDTVLRGLPQKGVHIVTCSEDGNFLAK